MKIGIISGSTRQKKPQSAKVAKFIQALVLSAANESYLLDLSQTAIKYWDETFWSNYAGFDANWAAASLELHSCDALVIVAPEWNGMLPPALLNIFHLATKGEFANKPALIVSVSAAINGVYPLTQLRLNTFKNTFINYIPEHVIVRNVGGVLNDPREIASDEDKYIRERLSYSLQVLAVYAEAFKLVRNSPLIQSNPYPYGM